MLRDDANPLYYDRDLIGGIACRSSPETPSRASFEIRLERQVQTKAGPFAIGAHDIRRFLSAPLASVWPCPPQHSNCGLYFIDFGPESSFSVLFFLFRGECLSMETCVVSPAEGALHPPAHRWRI